MSHRASTLFVLSLLTATAVAAQGAVAVRFDDPGFPDAASAATGEWLRVTGVPVLDLPRGATLELQAFEVFAPDARIVVHGADGDSEVAVPETRFFRGYIEERPGSLAYLSIRESGETRGILSSGGSYWVVGNFDGERRLPALDAREVPPDAFADEQERFECGVERLGLSRSAPAVAGPERAPTGGTTYTARVAIETDNEFLTLFGGDTGDATDYIGDLIGFSSSLYAAEIDTDFFITFISLWTGSDPWSQTSTACGLFEFGRHWNDNYGGSAGGDVYTVSQFLSGKNNGGGIAWVGVLCSGEFNWNHEGNCPGLSPNIDNYGGPYGYSGDLDGNFNVNNPSVVWDIIVVSHEIGHNFDSPHTHCYAGLQGNPNPIDECFSGEMGCYMGATSLPSGCPGSGQGCGTIMSYCHLLSPGISNIDFSFGTGHPYGIAPQRVPAQMTDHVVATANAFPACMAPVATIFTDGFESGDTSAWSSTVP